MRSDVMHRAGVRTEDTEAVGADIRNSWFRRSRPRRNSGREGPKASVGGEGSVGDPLFVKDDLDRVA